jgi:hypothetical protein
MVNKIIKKDQKYYPPECDEFYRDAYKKKVKKSIKK